MPFTTIFFDLDDTLYPASTGLWNAIRERMSRYMWERLSLPKDEVPMLRRAYFETYGTTLRGLQIHYGVDSDEYLTYVHDLPLKAYLKPDPLLNELLVSLPQAKWIFTNADGNHARRVLDELGVDGCFKGIIDVRALGFACKPELEAYQRAMVLANEVEPLHCVLLDDSVRNLELARNLGFHTILVGTDQHSPAAYSSIRSLHDLPQVMPELWAEQD